ncbi:MAG: ATP synthase F1, epsilon subunit [Parcubacteria group bacterium GW2011_GWA2_45_30]|nr:MAG: ATP synthase F1, epsilon subunit [Parcubacteria group bacterium GW2011_GWA2_45_30]
MNNYVNKNIPNLSVTVRDREGVLFQGETEAVSSFNAKGPFDVLPLHANFISLIRNSVTLKIPSSSPKEIMLNSGVIKVKENKVEVYVGILR